VLSAFNRADIDGFYGEPAEFDAALEVELLVAPEAPVIDESEEVTSPIHRIREVALAAETISIDGLEDAWFGNFDENAELPADTFEDEATTTWGKIGDWLKNLGRAA
jgi:hypothetical protein